jgi:hypothetical protein
VCAVLFFAVLLPLSLFKLLVTGYLCCSLRGAEQLGQCSRILSRSTGGAQHREEQLGVLAITDSVGTLCESSSAALGLLTHAAIVIA